MNSAAIVNFRTNLVRRLKTIAVFSFFGPLAGTLYFLPFLAVANLVGGRISLSELPAQAFGGIALSIVGLAYGISFLVGLIPAFISGVFASFASPGTRKELYAAWLGPTLLMGVFALNVESKYIGNEIAFWLTCIAAATTIWFFRSRKSAFEIHGPNSESDRT